ncbi:hypothetical protein Rsub_12588 [Raphidocelis subcapitata]|uniref:AB hydrolase-1 domain-containing protein n=1 Tax=Raphidocelis subcapitata TaxID=307507 RepID=A0A2V0PIM1_9CHLO|nr:hypothetical protein Rsub_12588 [Raphidocelis subcapitata]|eukprot:GBF99651.1 hypothetical protein Rsub_12588 [Raphidocelis subcapitata]
MAARRSLVRLRSGRQLAYCVFGDAEAETAAVYYHGWPSSLQEAAVLNAPAAVAGVRLVAFDRPGVGGTSPVDELSFRAVADDVEQLMDALGMESAMQIGTSGGGPYAAATAALLGPRRAPAVVLIASMTHLRGPGSGELLRGMEPFQRACFRFMEYAPAWLVRYGLAVCVAVSRCVIGPLFWAFAWLASFDGRSGCYGRISSSSGGGAGSGGGGGKQAAGGAVKRRTQGLGRRATAATGLGLVWDAVRGPRLALGWWQDMELTSQPWVGFSLAAVQQPTLILRGGSDICVTSPMLRHLAANIPGARAPRALEAAAALRAKLPAVCPVEGTACVEVAGRGHVTMVARSMKPVLLAAKMMLPDRVTGAPE